MYSFRGLLWIIAIVGLTMGIAWRRERLRRQAVAGGPPDARVLGHVERCLVCHRSDRESPGGAHAAAAVGCSSCHLGNPYSYSQEIAHEGLEKEPGALDTVDATCGQTGCHEREVAHVHNSLMSTGRGMIAVDRYALGERNTPHGMATFADLLHEATPSAADDHFRKLCFGCHLGLRKEQYGPSATGTGAGCGACHSPTAAERRQRHDSTNRHVAVSADVPDARCFGCHSRSGRISLSYEGLAEVFPRRNVPVQHRLPDGRPAISVTPDVHYRAGMQCIDCHVHTELMGGDDRYAHENEQVEIRCTDCHARENNTRVKRWAAVDDPITRALLRARRWSPEPDDFLRVTQRNTPLYNVRRHGRNWQLWLKNRDKALPVRPTPRDAEHTLQGHERLSCQACHTAWAPQCATCHTTRIAGDRQWDYAVQQQTPGRWTETSEEFRHRAPVLGVNSRGNIYPFLPGMVMTVQTDGHGPVVCQRLYAPVDAHTTAKEGRTCASCHRNPEAVGLGSGMLLWKNSTPGFIPARRSHTDSRYAVGAWTTLFPPAPGRATRKGARSLDVGEQRCVFRVGLCVPCHTKASDAVYKNFTAAVRRLQAHRASCPFHLPAWAAEQPATDRTSCR